MTDMLRTPMAMMANIFESQPSAHEPGLVESTLRSQHEISNEQKGQEHAGSGPLMIFLEGCFGSPKTSAGRITYVPGRSHPLT
jgi:hypothetical protein